MTNEQNIFVRKEIRYLDADAREKFVQLSVYIYICVCVTCIEGLVIVSSMNIIYTNTYITPFAKKLTNHDDFCTEYF